MRKLLADGIHTGAGGLMSGKVILVDHHGVIQDILPAALFEESECEYFPGLLVPGFINAHCHLELSHLKGRFQTGTRLIPFLKSVVSQRDTDIELVMQSIKEADQDMLSEGIVAVGDISNKTDTLEIKRGSAIYYHSFIEAFDFLQDQLANQFYESYLKVYDAFDDLPRTLVPHAPYSVSKKLFSLISNHNRQDQGILSIHNQETVDEDLLFHNKSGGFVEFWNSFGFSMDDFQPTGKESVYYAMEYLQNDRNILFIHNTQMKEAQVRDVMKWNPNSFFVTCPNANLFIENTMPDYKQFINAGARLCIGTDSLSSNWHLSILEEVKTILKYNSHLKLSEVLQWATDHGAKALGIADRFGSIAKNKQPGINWIRGASQQAGEWKLEKDASVERIL